ncbi:succinate dehydrogenase assembly factor 1, mitochondrial [Trifolium repens]|nr:succinate dehydrogenase assembly factor 1, mitochondrial [Trifolium repens]
MLRRSSSDLERATRRNPLYKLSTCFWIPESLCTLVPPISYSSFFLFSLPQTNTQIFSAFSILFRTGKRNIRFEIVGGNLFYLIAMKLDTDSLVRCLALCCSGRRIEKGI